VGPALLADDLALAAMGETGVRSSVLTMLAHVEYEEGRLEDAQRYADLAASLTQPDDLSAEVLVRTARARVLAQRGDWATAEAMAREAVALAAESDWICLHGDALLDLAAVQHGAGKRVSAVASAEVALRLYRQKGDLASGDRARAFLRTLQDP
jgi:tetratricopeptide (TPR) repeat protein